MGRIKTQLVKRLTFQLIERYGDRFTADFNHNKVEVEALTTVQSNKIRNLIAGYATRLTRVKAQKK